MVTYLANTLKHGDKQIAYSTISGVNSIAELEPLLDDSGQPLLLADNEVVLNRWAADALEASFGDTITVTYYEPESTHGKLVEAGPLELRLQAIVELATPAGQPTRAADPRLTPVMEGVTDADSIDDWEMPFELVEPITPADEEYWDEHSTTPKAFVSLDLAKKLWSTRWGSISLLRLPVTAENPLTVEQAAAKLREAIDPADLGLAFQPIKRLGLVAASGTTPFDGLFFGFSLFLIASAVMLITLLYRLGIDSRAREVGLLTATGWTPQQVRRLLTSEGLLVAAVGAAVGIAGGVAYAWLMLAGLRTLWVEAIVTPFLNLHVRPASLLIGFAVGILVTWLTIVWSLRGLAKVSPRSLLAGKTVDPIQKPRSAKRWRWFTLVVFAVAIGLSLRGAQQQGEVQAGLFFGAGALMLLALLMRTRAWLLSREVRTAAPNPFGLGALAMRNIARNPGRSLLTIALVAAASFLILAISAFRLPPTTAGAGGYDWVAQTDQPLHFDLNTPAGRDEYGFPEERQRLLRRCHVDALRVYDGEDASCLNLYQTSQPRGARRARWFF